MPSENFALLPKKEQEIYAELVEASEMTQGADFGYIISLEC